jgi:hypothetical protein
MTCKPVSHYGSWISLVLAALSFFGSFWLAQSLPGAPLNANLFWGSVFSLILFLLGLYLIYRAVALFTMRYQLSRNGLEIRAAAQTFVIPMAEIEDIHLSGENEVPSRSLGPLSLPQWWYGRWGRFRFFSTTETYHTLVVKTTGYNWVISPPDRLEFIKAWQLRRDLGPTQLWQEHVARWRFFGWPIWLDSLMWRLVGGAVLLCLIVLGATLTAYPTWPATFTLNFGGQAEMLIDRAQLLWLPGSGSIILLVNVALGAWWYRQERMLAYTIWSIALLAQVAVWIGLRLVVG